MAHLDLDIALRLRRFELAVALTVGRETVALLGPSGAGKSTILRAVAGLQRPDRGRIAHGDEVWLDRARRVDLAPERRSVGLVFQDYALFPHLSVRDNVAFGKARDVRVDDELERLRIGHLAGERPGVLSGGERQRVAVARALARRPAVLLLDEPLAALDAHTRAHVRAELLTVLTDAALPTLLVTHDVRDAMTLADRLGVVVDGRLRQVGTPAEVLDAPADAFVAELTGANVLPGTAAAGTVALDTGGALPAPAGVAGRVVVVVHPWDVRAGDGPGVVVRGTVEEVTPEGPRTRVRIGALTAEVPSPGVGLRRGDAGVLRFDPGDARVVPAG